MRTARKRYASTQMRFLMSKETIKASFIIRNTAVRTNRTSKAQKIANRYLSRLTSTLIRTNRSTSIIRVRPLLAMDNLVKCRPRMGISMIIKSFRVNHLRLAEINKLTMVPQIKHLLSNPVQASSREGERMGI